jgi:hypothetical protein
MGGLGLRLRAFFASGAETEEKRNSTFRAELCISSAAAFSKPFACSNLKWRQNCSNLTGFVQAGPAHLASYECPPDFQKTFAVQ